MKLFVIKPTNPDTDIAFNQIETLLRRYNLGVIVSVPDSEAKLPTAHPFAERWPITASAAEAEHLRGIRNMLISDQQRTDFDRGQLVECNACARKAGMPSLCGPCLANRTRILELRSLLHREKADRERERTTDPSKPMVMRVGVGDVATIVTATEKAPDAGDWPGAAREMVPTSTTWQEPVWRRPDGSTITAAADESLGRKPAPGESWAGTEPRSMQDPNVQRFSKDGIQYEVKMPPEVPRAVAGFDLGVELKGIPIASTNDAIAKLREMMRIETEPMEAAVRAIVAMGYDPSRDLGIVTYDMPAIGCVALSKHMVLSVRRVDAFEVMSVVENLAVDGWDYPVKLRHGSPPGCRMTVRIESRILTWPEPTEVKKREIADRQCPPGFFCIHEPKCPGAAR